MWTIDDINKQRLNRGQDPLPAKKVVEQVRSEAKGWIGMALIAFKIYRKFKLEKEYRFKSPRRWRADWAIIDELRGFKVLIEYEGLFSKKSRHTTASGFSGDTEKYNAAALDGWIVLRYTAKTYKNLDKDLRTLYERSN